MSKSKIELIYEDTITRWRNNKGIGSIYFPKPLNVFPIILNILERVYAKTPDSKTIIVTDTLDTSNYIRNAIINSPDEDNNKEFIDLLKTNKILITTQQYRINFYDIGKIDLCISYGINEYSDAVDKLFSKSTFKLMCLTELISDIVIRKKLYEHCVLISNINTNQLISLNLDSPVEEHRYGTPLSPEDRINYDKFDEFIVQSSNIFGGFEALTMIRNGDPKSNTSSAAIRENIARNNGWSYDLDMTLDYNRSIDVMYNPDSLLDRATEVFNFVRKRNALVSDNESKLIKLLELCYEYKDKKILIVSKSIEFAEKVANHINSNIINTNKGLKGIHPACLLYINTTGKVPAINDDGSPIMLKSKKYEQKMIGSIGQKAQSERLFNGDYANIISTNNACDKNLCALIDILIITSPLCDTINELKYRLSNIQFNTLPNKVIKLYMVNTIEQKRLTKEKLSHLHEIVNKSETCITLGDNSDIIVVD